MPPCRDDYSTFVPSVQNPREFPSPVRNDEDEQASLVFVHRSESQSLSHADHQTSEAMLENLESTVFEHGQQRGLRPRFDQFIVLVVEHAYEHRFDPVAFR